MWRLIFIGLIIFLIIYVIKRGLRQPDAPQTEEKKSAHDSEDSSEYKSDNSEVEDMVQCTHCAIHLPRSEAFLVDGKIYCSRAHIQNK